MLKHCILILLLLFFSTNASASFWDDLGSCLSNPCNCGFGDQLETWGGKTYNRGAQNPLCPPWNKSGGRDHGTCLLQFDYPGIFIPWYLEHCAEDTPENNFFVPKIRIRYQSCNAVACWTLSKTLRGDGECMVWPTGYALPLLRICARIANPASSSIDPITNTITTKPADPGYTYGKHLNREGATEDDKIITGSDGQPIQYNKPKLCAYRDPSMLDVVSVSGINLDLMDYNPVHQPMHRTTALHPIARILIFLVENNPTAMLTNLLSSVFGSEAAAEVVSVVVMGFVPTMINIVGQQIVIPLIKEFGQFNRVVDDYLFGCVELPIGPLPPPYCNPLQKCIPSPKVHAICAAGQQSTVNAPCVVSNVRNNFIHNSVRISLDNIVPLCLKGVDPLKTDKCVTFSNMPPASIIHTATAYKDFIKPCSGRSGANTCVNTSISFNPFPCNGSTGNLCQDGFRIVYAKKLSNTVIVPNDSFIDILDETKKLPLPDCNGSNTPCQVVWGVNTGQFIDVPLVFPRIQQHSDIVPLTATSYINDSIGAKRTFVSSINRFPDQQSGQNPTQICVVEGASLIGCTTRQSVSKPHLYDCSKYGLCTNDYYTPAFVARLETGSDSTMAVVKPLSAGNPRDPNYSVNLAGYNFSSFVTDDTFIMQPFGGSHSFIPSSIYGTYKNDAAPYDNSGKLNNNAVYLYGLEYFNNRYIQGGKYSCLTQEDLTHCPNNTKNCVLTNLLNRDIVNCSAFSNTTTVSNTTNVSKTAQYPNLRLCTSDFSNCKAIDSMPGKNGGSGITINQCSNGKYCYTNSQNVSICQISMDPGNRVYPYPPDQTLLDTAYYDVDAANNPTGNSNRPAGNKYDSNLYTLRDKTPSEFGLCIPIPQPTCAAITNPGPNDGNATWPQTLVGQQATGQCIQGYAPTTDISDLKRYCLSSVKDDGSGKLIGSIRFDALDKNAICKKQASISLTSQYSSLPDSYNDNMVIQPGSITVGNLDAPISLTKPTDSIGLQILPYQTVWIFEITDLSAVQYFRINQIGYDDYVSVSVNERVVYSGSGNKGPDSSFTALQNWMYYVDTNHFWRDYSTIDLMGYLQNGINTIDIRLIVVGGGGLYYKIEYAVKPN